MLMSNYETARTRYLKALLARYGTLAIPISSREHRIALETVFQPLELSQRSLRALKDAHEGQIQGIEGQDAAYLDGPVRVRDGSEALEKSPGRRLLILGGPGMGKTTLLKALLQKTIRAALLEPAAPIPLFLSLPDLARSGETLTSYLPHLLAELEIESTFAAELNSALASGRAFLCLDSLDEVMPAQRPDIIALINQQASQYSGTWIIGSRFTEYQGGQFAGGRFVEWELLPLDDKLRRQLADHLLPLLRELFQEPALSTETFLHALANDQRIAEWGENPLLFSLAAIAYARRAMLPASRVALHAAIIDAILAQRFSDPATREVLRHQLAHLSLDLYQTRGRNFSLQDVRELLTSYQDIPHASELYLSLAQILDSGVLDVVAYQTYGFKHQMFQEYLAAVALANQLLDRDEQIAQGAWDFILRKSTYSRWREILRLLVGVLVQEHGAPGGQLAANWLQHLASAHTTPEGDPGQLRLLLALNSLPEFPATSYTPRLAEAVRQLLITWAETIFRAVMMGSGSAYIGAAWADQRIADHIFNRLKQSIEHIQRLNLSLVLPALSALERTFEQAKALEVQAREEEKVGELLRDFVLAIPARVLTLAFPAPETIDLFTIVTLQKLDGIVAIADLIALMEKPGEQWQARTGAARLLGMTSDPVAQLALCRVLVDTSCHSGVRVVAAEVLGWISGSLSAAALIQAARDKDERVCLAALKAMRELGPDMPVQTLLAALSNPRPDIRLAAGDALGLLHEQLSLEPLLQALRHEDAEIRLQVLAALHTIQERTARVPLAAIAPLLHDANYEVRLRSIHILGHFMDERALPLLLEALHDATPKSHIGEALGAASVVELLKFNQKMPEIQKWVTPAHIEQALEENFFDYYHLLTLASALQIPLPPSIVDAFLQRYLADLKTSSWIYEPQKKVRYLLNLGINVDLLVATLLDLLQIFMLTLLKNVAQALLALYQHVPSEPIVAWLAEVDITSPERLGLRNDELANAFALLSELLVRQGKKIAPEPLLYLLKHARSRFGMTEVITRTLMLMGSDAPVGHLFGLLCDALDHQYAEKGAGVLASLYEQLTPETIYQEAAHRQDDEIIAIDVLGARQDEVSVELLMGVLKDEARDNRLRVHALFALHDMGAQVPLEYYVLGQDWCYHGVDDNMVAAMTRLGAQAPFVELVHLLGYGNNWVRTSARRSLQHLAEYAPVDLVLEALKGKNEHMREEAAYALAAFGARVPTERLLTLVGDKRELVNVRRAALSTLSKIGFRMPIELLLSLIQIDNYNLRQTVFGAFGAMGREAPREVLLQLLDDSELRSGAIEMLGSLEDNAPVELLLTIFDADGPGQFDRSNAAEALAKLGKYAPVEEMVARLYDGDGEMRPKLIKAFGALGEYAPFDVILRALENTRSDTREEANRALSKLAENVPAKLIAEARHDPRPVVRKHVLEAVVKLGKDGPVEIILAALDEEETRADALAALRELGAHFPSLMSRDRLVLLLRAEDTARELNLQELELLEQYGEPIPVDLLLAELGGGSSSVAEQLYKRYPSIFQEVVALQAEAILRGEPVEGVFASLVQSRIAKAIGQIGRATPQVLSMVVDLLDWPYQETRLEAVRALGAIHRNIPDRALRRLLEMSHDPGSAELRQAADIALADILAYEDGMEEEA